MARWFCYVYSLLRVKRTKAFSIDCFYRLFLSCFCGFFSHFETGFYLIDHSHLYRGEQVFDHSVKWNEMFKCDIVKRTKAVSIDCFYRLFLLCFCGFFSHFETGFYLIDHSHLYRGLFDLRRDFAVCNWPQISLSISGKHTIAWIFISQEREHGNIIVFL